MPLNGQPDARAALAALLDALPRCWGRGCLRPATQGHDYSDDLTCDECDTGYKGTPKMGDLSYAAAVRAAQAVVDDTAVSSLEADLLLELDKAQEGTEGPLDTLRRLVRDAAETATLRARVEKLEVNLAEALKAAHAGSLSRMFLRRMWGRP